MIKSFIAVVFCLLMWGCASDKPEGKTKAEVLFKEAKILVEEERYLLATEKLNNLKNQYPYSYYATPAELLQAEILFLQESYVESAAAFILFRDFHPKHEKIAYVLFKIAESYFMQIPDTFDRDLEAATEAVKYFNELLSKYPNSEYTKGAKGKMKKAKGMLRDKEKYVADFYFKTEVYSAARWRYFDILDHFKNKELRSHSMQRIVRSSYYLKEYKECLNYANKYSSELKKNDKKIIDEYIVYCKNKL